MEEFARDLRVEVSLPGELLDLDGALGPGWTAVARTPQGQVLLIDGDEVPIPQPCRYPLIRQIDSDTVFLVDSRTTPGQENAWVVDRTGKVHARFFVGDGIQDILANRHALVVTYFDEGVFGGDGPNQEGVAVFSLRGDLALGFNSTFRTPLIADCYCTCWISDQSIAFIPYTDFPFVRLDLRTNERTAVKLPEALHSPAALSVRGEYAVLWSPSKYKNTLVRWRIGASDFDLVDEHAGPLRGLTGGRFFSGGSAGYTVISPLE